MSKKLPPEFQWAKGMSPADIEAEIAANNAKLLWVVPPGQPYALVEIHTPHRYASDRLKQLLDEVMADCPQGTIVFVVRRVKKRGRYARP